MTKRDQNAKSVRQNVPFVTKHDKCDNMWQV